MRRSTRSKSTRPPPDETPHLRPLTLRPPELVPLDDTHERRAVEALAGLLADHLDRHATETSADAAGRLDLCAPSMPAERPP